MNTIEQVKEFHTTFQVKDPAYIDISNIDVAALRVRLLQEELDELNAALIEENVVEVLDALTDLQYVLDGAYLAFGLSHLKDKAFAEVHRSNMSKLGVDGKPIFREGDRKVLKGPNYSEPNLAKIIEEDIKNG